MTTPRLEREEYIEQAYFFRTYRERLEHGSPSQEVLQGIGEEVLSTTRLPMAIDFLRAEILHKGRISDGMARLPHYFTSFQTFVLSRAEEEKSRFDQTIALVVLEREAEYRASEAAGPQGLFVYQFECVARNRLGYDGGLRAMAQDPMYDDDWRDWIPKLRLRLGTADLADLIYYRSEHYVHERRRLSGRPDYRPSYPILFGLQEGRIARANRGKDPLYMFAALERQLAFPAVPRARPRDEESKLHPAVEQRLQRMEQRLKLLETEVKGEFDLREFYVNPPKLPEDP